jgi:hypothetical protein
MKMDRMDIREALVSLLTAYLDDMSDDELAQEYRDLVGTEPDDEPEQSPSSDEPDPNEEEGCPGEPNYS